MEKLLVIVAFSVLLIIPIVTQNSFAGAGPDEDKDNDGFSTNQGDCDDNDETVFPGAPEKQDGKDNDCNGVIDEGFEILVGGTLISIESTSLIISGTQKFSWMIPVILTGLGIGLFVFAKSEST